MKFALVILAIVLQGCAASPPRTLGSSAVFRVTETGADAGRLERIRALRVPANATVTIEPIWFVGRLRDMRPDLRPQVLIRTVLEDGGVVSWETHDGASPIPARWNPRQRYKISLGGTSAGPIRARGLARLEVLVADLDGSVVTGVSGVERLLTPESGSWAASESAAQALSADLELVGQVPILIVDDAPPGEQLLHLTIVEAEPSIADEDGDNDIARLASSYRLLRTVRDGDLAVADKSGRPIAQMSALTLRLKLEVVDHDSHPDPGVNQEEKKEEDWDKHRWMREPAPRQLSALERSTVGR